MNEALHSILPVCSAALAAFAVTLYVVLDGFDLGVGAVLLTLRDEELRDRMVDAIAPTWDGNETWLIMAGVALLAAFPVAYAILLPALYIPLILMLMALGCRGVSFEFRAQPGNLRILWDRAFGLGSIVAALCQGLVVGAMIEGIAVDGENFAGSVLDVIRPFPLLTAITLLAGYCVTGMGWVYYKSEGRLAAHARLVMKIALPIFAVLSTLTIMFATWVQPQVGIMWEAEGSLYLLVVGGFLGALARAWITLDRADDLAPFTWSVSAFVIAIAGLAMAVFPDIVPFRLSLWKAASPTHSHLFLILGAVFVMPVVLAYNAFAYRVFRGKVPEHGYED